MGVIVKIDWLERAYWTVVPDEQRWNDPKTWTRHEVGPDPE